jgi:hypothetical protein
MSGLNDRGLHWFPRKCVINHAHENTHGMRRECGTRLTMTRQRARRHTPKRARAVQHHKVMLNVSAILLDRNFLIS